VCLLVVQRQCRAQPPHRYRTSIAPRRNQLVTRAHNIILLLLTTEMFSCGCFHSVIGSYNNANVKYSQIRVNLRSFLLKSMYKYIRHTRSNSHNTYTWLYKHSWVPYHQTYLLINITCPNYFMHPFLLIINLKIPTFNHEII
jgi:hypothetical protein